MAPRDYWWVQPTVVSVGIVVALAAIYWSRRVARLKATIDLIEASESRDYYQERYMAYREYRKGSAFRDGVLNPRDEPTCQKNRDYCLDFLNHYALVAIACRKGIIDETFYKLWMGPTLIRDWNAATELVRVARVPKMPGDSGSSLANSEFERLAVSWGGSRLR